MAQKTTLESLLAFFRGEGKNRRKRRFGGMTAAEAMKIIRLAAKDDDAVVDVLTFAKTHKKVARSVTEQDVQDAMDAMAVQEVMER